MSSNEAVESAPAPDTETKARTDRQSSRWRSPDEPCLNCGDPTYGRYCPSCGQRKLEVEVSVRTMLKDVLEDQLALSGALPRTLVSLLFRPGHLTNEYIRGRIVSYIAPFRLYLVASVVFFVLFSFFGLAALERAQVSVTEFENVARTREALAEFERELAAMDTAAMPEPARAALRMSLANLQTAFAQAIEDSTAAARAFAEMTGQVPGGPVAPPAPPGAENVPAPPSPADAAAAEATARAEAAAEQASGREAIADGNDATPTGSTDAAGSPDSSALAARSGAEAPPVVTPGLDRLQPWARNIRSDSRFPMLDRAVQRKVQQVGHLAPREALSQVARDYVEFAPHMIFLLLPVFALLLKGLYVRTGRYYAEHFVFALHTHAFAFLTFTLVLLIPWDWIDRILLFWMVVYMWIAMRRVYRQGAVRTTLKWWVLGWSYGWVFLFGMIGLAIVMLLGTT